MTVADSRGRDGRTGWCGARAALCVAASRRRLAGRIVSVGVQRHPPQAHFRRRSTKITAESMPVPCRVADGRCCGRWPMLSPKAVS
eukprot:762477-Prymnesium_polylepis.1